MIGEFSELTGISKRMIRHFDEMGLLAPNRIDDFTGYRFYSNQQVQDATKIRYLQDLGFSLKEIQDLLTVPKDAPTLLEILKDQEVKLRYDADLKNGQLLRLKQLIDRIVYEACTLDELPMSAMDRGLDEKRSLQMDNPNSQTPALKTDQPLTKDQPLTTAQLLTTDQPSNSAIYERLKSELRALPSATMLQDHMEEQFKTLNGMMTAYITFDIDYFLRVNDTYGFDVGDRVIYRFYALLKDAFSDLLYLDARNRIARIGGDEIVLLLVGVERDLILKVISKALDAIRQHDFSLEGCPSPITSSCGLALMSQIDHPHIIQHQCSKALIAAKRNGRDQYCLYEA